MIERNMIMKKLFALLLVLVLALSLAACGENEDGGASGTNDAQGGQSTSGSTSSTQQGNNELANEKSTDGTNKTSNTKRGGNDNVGYIDVPSSFNVRAGLPGDNAMYYDPNNGNCKISLMAYDSKSAYDTAKNSNRSGDGVSESTYTNDVFSGIKFSLEMDDPTSGKLYGAYYMFENEDRESVYKYFMISISVTENYKDYLNLIDTYRFDK